MVFCIFVARLVDWQIVNHDSLLERAQSRNVYFVKTSAIRGEIVDSDGNGFAINTTGYRVIIDRLNIENENQTILKTVNLLKDLKTNWIDVLPICFCADKFEFIEDKKFEINALKKHLKLNENSTAEDCINKMAAKFKCEDFKGEDLRIICSVRYNMDKNGAHNSKVFPHILADNITPEVMMILSECTAILKGIKIEPSHIRKYINPTLAPHIIGYTGIMSSEDYEKYKDDYSIDDVIGKTGIESVMEKYLRGKSGKKRIQLAKDNTIVNSVNKEENVPGNTVFLTIKKDLQEAVYKSLEENIKKSQEKGAKDCKTGTAVVLDIKDFSVLAAVTYPNYDLERFMNDRAYYNELVADCETVPLLNRAFNGAFTPGSIYKPVVACAALQEGLISEDEEIGCGGAFSFYRGYRLKCMKIHGRINIVKAIAGSCNTFFAELGRRIGAEKLAEYAKRFGFGSKTGIELSESKGIVAGPDHSNLVGSKWYESGSSQAAIGQSDNMLTPLQMATYTATIANGGKRLKTHLIKKVTNFTRSHTLFENYAEQIDELRISEENLKLVQKSMREVALNGTARSFREFPVTVACKTGTAEVPPKDDHTTFICYAPYEDPQIAVAVVIANGKFGSSSINVAKDALKQYFGFNAPAT